MRLPFFEYIFEELDSLVTTNAGLYIAILGGIIVVSLAAYFLLIRKIGKVDERTALIRLKIDRIAFGSGLVAMAVYVTSISPETTNITQLSLVPLAFTFVAGMSAAAWYATKDQ